MQAPIFIARQLSTSDSSSFTRVIVRLGIIAVAVSLCVLLLTSALIAGFQREITQKVFHFWGHIHITHVESDRSIDAIPMDKSDIIFESIREIESIEYMDVNQQTVRTNGGVSGMYPFIHYPGILSTKDAFDGVICKGVDEQFDWTFIEEYLVSGHIFSEQTEPYHDQCILSQIQADRLQVGIADNLLLNFIIDGKQIRKRVRVVGIYNTGLEEYDRKFVIVDQRLLQNVLDWEANQVSGYALFVDNVDDIIPLNEYIYLEELPPQLYSESIRNKFPGIFEWLDLQQVNERVLLIIMLIVAFVNLSTVMIILILDRIKMVAILKSLGARTVQIMQVFIYVIGGIVLKGFIIGNGLALVLGLLQHKYQFIKLNQADYYLSYAPVEFDLFKILLINTLAFILIISFMIIPSIIISSVKPVKTLRFN